MYDKTRVVVSNFVSPVFVETMSGDLVYISYIFGAMNNAIRRILPKLFSVL